MSLYLLALGIGRRGRLGRGRRIGSRWRRLVVRLRRRRLEATLPAGESEHHHARERGRDEVGERPRREGVRVGVGVGGASISDVCEAAGGGTNATFHSLPLPRRTPLTPTRERTGHLKGGRYSHESTRSMLSSTTMLRGRWIASVLVRLARRSFASDGCGSSSSPAAAPAAAAPRAPGRPVPPLLRPTQPPSHRRDSKKSNQYASTFVSWSRSPVVRVLIFLPRTRPSSNLARQQRGTTRVGQPSTQSGEKRSR